ANVCDETASGDRLRKTKCIFRLDGNTFMSIVRREIKPQQALFQRKVQIRGDMLLALKMNVLVNYL
ncbi:MAG: SCP2 sterol-binding domain-containing protein, partial [Planctomycetes bacterium]|nr:SCP2 sterol-binding domain-containing protein [Planctomycetota bacterium]